ncbi:MAG: hypothetical protein AAF404_12190, partial [Pseudomonadota bacterium]
PNEGENGSNVDEEDTTNTADTADSTDDSDATVSTENTSTTDTTTTTDNNPESLPDVVTGLAANHRSGQTFLTWNEVDASSHYHVYRSDQPITTANLSSATLLTDRWGPIDQDSSMHKFGSVDVPVYLVIEDEGLPLDPTTGLHVHTTQNNEAGNAYYAVTSVDNDTENQTLIADSNTLSTAVPETVATPKPILVSSFNSGKGRVYSHFMDYTQWNPTLNGYVFNYTIALPQTFDPARAYPLQVVLHDFGGRPNLLSETEHQWETVQLFPNDPGPDENTVHTWWYGHAADHNYLTEGSIPDSGLVENFTEHRVMIAIDEVIANPDINIDTNLIHAYGNSMGAGGALSLGMRYPSVFSGIYASQPMTNFATSPLFQDDMEQLWGEKSTDLPNIIRGTHTSDIAKYSADGSQPVSTWNWLNSQQQFRDRSADNFSYLIIDVGKADNTIHYPTQGEPLIQALTDGKIPFSAILSWDADHGWADFNAVNIDQFGLNPESTDPWLYPNSLSFVALQNASGSGPLPPLPTFDDYYNINIEWSTTANNFHEPMVDTATRYEVSLRSTGPTQTVSVTPRNTSAFKPTSGQICTWNAQRNSDSTFLGNGNIIVDSNHLATAVEVPVETGTGSRLVIECP